MSWCTSGVGLQVLPFIDKRHLGSIHRFQWFACFDVLIYNSIVFLWSKPQISNLEGTETKLKEIALYIV